MSTSENLVVIFFVLLIFLFSFPHQGFLSWARKTILFWIVFFLFRAVQCTFRICLWLESCQEIQKVSEKLRIIEEILREEMGW